MGISKYTLYKYVKVDGTWRYCKAAYHDNSKIKLDIVFVDAKKRLEAKHPEGRYYMSHNGGSIDASTDALEAQRKRKQRLALDEFKRLSGKDAVRSSALLPDSSGRITLAAATEKYFANCEARGLDPETIRKYRCAIDPFVEHCGVTYVDECREGHAAQGSDGFVACEPRSARARRENDSHLPRGSCAVCRALQSQNRRGMPRQQAGNVRLHGLVAQTAKNEAAQREP